MINYLNNKFFHFSKKTLEFGLSASVLGFTFSFLHVKLNPHNLNLISASIGVFILSLILAQMIHEPLDRKIKYGFWSSIAAGITLALGGYFHHSFLIVTIILFFLTWIVSFSNLVNQDFFNAVILIGHMFIIGTGYPIYSLMDCIDNGIGFFAGGVFITSTLFFFCHKEKNKFSAQHFIRIPKIKKVTGSFILFGIQLCFVVIVANTISHYFHLPDGYWIPMTALLVLRPDPAFSKERIKHRFWGTFLGCFAGIPLSLIENKLMLSFFMIPVLFFIVVSIVKHYGTYVFFVTAMISIQMSMTTMDGVNTVMYRMINTAIAILLLGSVVLVDSMIRNNFQKAKL